MKVNKLRLFFFLVNNLYIMTEQPIPPPKMSNNLFIFYPILGISCHYS